MIVPENVTSDSHRRGAWPILRSPASLFRSFFFGLPPPVSASPRPRARAGAGLAALLTLVAMTAPALAQQESSPDEEFVVSRAVIPAIGQIVGAGGVLWRSDVVLINDLGESATVVISPLPLPDAFQMRTLEPGESILFTNVGADSFGIGSGVVPLLVQTLAGRSVTVFATAYGLDEGRLTPTIIVPTVYGEIPPSMQLLRGLTMTKEARTNVGIMNFGEEPAAVTLALQRLEGRPIAMQTVIVPPGGSHHVPLNLLFPLVEGGDEFTLVIDSTGPRTFSYAVVLSNDTHAGVFILPLAFPRM